MEVAPIFPLNEGINQVEYHVFSEEFSDEEIMWVNNLSKLYPPEKAQIGGSNIEESIRDSEIHWLKHDDNSKWLYDKLGENFMLSDDKLYCYIMEIIRFLSGYLQKLYLAKSDNIYRNQSPEVLVKKYNIFFKEADIFVNDLKSTSFEFLIDKMQKINQLEFNFKNLISSSSSREALLISSSIMHTLI